MPINLMTKYRGKLTEALDYVNVLSGKTSTEYEWNGVKGIYLTSVKTVPLTDYNRNTTGNRFGGQNEVQDEQQYLELQKDRSVALTIDKGNFKEGMMLKTAGAVIKDEMNEQVKPELEQFALNEWAKNAGQYGTVTDDDNGAAILGDLLQIEAAFKNARIPATERFAAVDANLFPYIRSALTNLDNVTDRMLFKGVVGRVGTLNLIEVPHGDMPTGCHVLAWWKRAVVNPQTITDADIHEKPENLSGVLINMRYRYGAFVVGKYAMGVYALLASSQRATAIAASTARVINPGGKTVKYTVDGTDPRYSKSAVTITGSSNITVPSTDAPVGSTIKTVVYDASKPYPSDISSTVVAS
jgi:hypothetical protein